MIKILYILCLTVSFCCKSSTTLSTKKSKDYNASVGATGDCGNSRLLTIYKNDGSFFLDPVYEINLPDSLKVEGLKLLIEWRNPVDNEMMRCLTLGPGYEQIYIVKALRVD